MKKLIKIYFFFSFLFSISLNADEIKRKPFHLLFTPWTIQSNSERYFRDIDNSLNIQFLYGVTNHFYLGVNYAIGQNGEERLATLPTGSYSTTRLFQYSNSKKSETISLNFQYFIWNSVYSSFNLGIEKGFTVERNNFVLIRGNDITLQPVQQKTIFDDRSFGSLGVGLRHEFFDHFLFALEYQIGLIESGKINQHFTYSPEYYGNNLPYIYESYLISNLMYGNDRKNSQFQRFFMSFGIAF